ncbi:MAG: TonB family protein [Rubrivivax sp.]|nr:TonB family protein [Rubrivivax sp.]
MALALMISFALHGIALSTQFTLVNPRLFEDLTPPMEVVLVNAKSREAPLKPDVLAQVDLAGGGNVDENRQKRNPLPFKADATEADPEAAEARVKQLEKQRDQLMTQLQSRFAADSAPQASPQKEINSADLMRQASLYTKELARISQQVEEDQKRPKREFLGSSAKRYVYARYVEDWAAKVERIGNLNYPEEARRQRIYGSLQMTACINSDGTVQEIIYNKPSDREVLNQAAERIINLGAPYAPFSREMRQAIWQSKTTAPFMDQGGKEIVLCITRTWMFTRSDQLVGSE